VVSVEFREYLPVCEVTMMCLKFGLFGAWMIQSAIWRSRVGELGFVRFGGCFQVLTTGRRLDAGVEEMRGPPGNSSQMKRETGFSRPEGFEVVATGPDHLSSRLWRLGPIRSARSGGRRRWIVTDATESPEPESWPAWAGLVLGG